MVIRCAAGEYRFAGAAEEALAQCVVAFQGRQQVGTLVIAGRMRIETRAVIDDGTVESLVEQPQPFDQDMDGAQHRPGNIVGVNLIAAHHQQRRALQRFLDISQQAVYAKQTFGCAVVRLAARAMQQVINAAAHHEVRVAVALVQQVRRPLGNTAFVLHPQVVIDPGVAGQFGFQLQVDQVNERLAPDCNDLTLTVVEYVIVEARRGIISSGMA